MIKLRNNYLLILERTINYGIVLLLFLVPLYFSYFYHDNIIFSLDKSVIFCIFVEILLLLSLAKILALKKVSIFLKPIHLTLVLLFFIMLCISTYFSVDVANSFWGSYQRQQGLYLHLHYLAFVLVLALNVKGKNQVENYLSTIVLSGLLVSFYGIMEWLGLDFLSWFNPNQGMPGQRIMSTIGQPVFVGNFLVLAVFISIYKLFLKQDFFVRIIYLLILILQLLALLFTYTRSAWVAFMISVFIACIYYFFRLQRKYKYLFTVVFLLAIGVIIVIISKPYYEYNNFFLYRFSSIRNLDSGSFAMRAKIWISALDAASENPILGYGLDNQEYVLIDYYEPTWGIHELINTTPDRTHNEIIDILLSGGLFSLLSFLLLLYASFRSALISMMQDKENQRLVFYLILSISAYIIALFASFSTVETNMVFWLYITCILLINNKYSEKKFFEFQSHSDYRGGCIVIIFITYSLASIWLIRINLNSIRADIYLRKARINYFHNNYQDMISNYHKATELNFRQNRYTWHFMSDLCEVAIKLNDKKFGEQAIEYIESSEYRQNNFYKDQMLSALIFTLYGLYKDQRYFNESEKIYIELANKHPFFPSILKEWGRMYMLKGDYKKALLIFNQAISVVPDENDPYLKELIDINYSHRREINGYKAYIFKYIGYSYFKLNNYKQSIEYYRKILDIDPFYAESLDMLSANYYLLKDLDKAIEYKQRKIKLMPGITNDLITIAVYYSEKNDKSNALEYAESALKTSPENLQLQNYIASLKSELNSK